MGRRKPQAKRLQDAVAEKLPAETPEGYCALHAVMMELRNNASGSWYSVCFRQARVNLDFQWPIVILTKGTR